VDELGFIPSSLLANVVYASTCHPDRRKIKKERKAM
jgi:hypothetical protein